MSLIDTAIDEFLMLMHKLNKYFLFSQNIENIAVCTMHVVMARPTWTRFPKQTNAQCQGNGIGNDIGKLTE